MLLNLNITVDPINYFQKEQMVLIFSIPSDSYFVYTVLTNQLCIRPLCQTVSNVLSRVFCLLYSLCHWQKLSSFGKNPSSHHSQLKICISARWVYISFLFFSHRDFTGFLSSLRGWFPGRRLTLPLCALSCSVISEEAKKRFLWKLHPCLPRNLTGSILKPGQMTHEPLSAPPSLLSLFSISSSSFFLCFFWTFTWTVASFEGRKLYSQTVEHQTLM